MVIPLGGTDIPCWADAPAETCTLKHMYKIIHQILMDPQLPRNWIWSLHIPSKLKFFVCKILHNRLSTASYLHDLMPIVSPLCICYHDAPKTAELLFTSCTFSKLIWTKLYHVHMNSCQHIHFSKFHQWFCKPDVGDRIQGIFVSWYLGKAHNDYLYNLKTVTSTVHDSPIHFQLPSMVGLSYSSDYTHPNTS